MYPVVEQSVTTVKFIQLSVAKPLENSLPAYLVIIRYVVVEQNATTLQWIGVCATLLKLSACSLPNT